MKEKISFRGDDRERGGREGANGKRDRERKKEKQERDMLQT